MIPPWLTAPQETPLTRRGGAEGFLEKTVRQIAAFTDTVLLTERLAAQDALLQRLHPSCKVPALVFFLVAVSLLRSPALVWSLYLLTLPLAVLSRIGLAYFLKRVWLFVPLFAAAVALPSMTSLVVPGNPLLTLRLPGLPLLWPGLPAEVSVTVQGVQTALLFVGRVAVSVSLTLLLTLTTRWSALFQALGVLKVPQIFVMVLSMTYRYVVVLTRSVGELHVARQSRTVRYLPPAAERRWVASRMGQLFRRSYRLSQEVHGAMLARGYSGEARSVRYAPCRAADYLFLAASAALCAILVAADRYLLS